MAILKANGNILKANGKVLVKPEGTLPEIIFASDDFVTIKTGELLSSNVTSADSHRFSVNSSYNSPFGAGVLDSRELQEVWNANKKYCLFSNKSISIKAPINSLNEFSMQFYYMSDGDSGRFHYCNPYTEIFSVYNDNWLITLLRLGDNSESFNGASIGTGPWSTNPTICGYRYYETGKVTFISIVYKRISGNTWRQYFYANGVLYFAFDKTLTTDNISISHTMHNPNSGKNCYLSEIMMFSYSRASQDMMTYPTNGYAPMFLNE